MPAEYARLESNCERERPSDGKSMKNLQARLKLFVDDLLTTSMNNGMNEYAQFEDGVIDNRIATVSHGITTRVLLNLLTDMTKEQKRRMHVPNNVVYQVEVSDESSSVSHYVDAQGPVRGFFSDPS